ncbi:hypothetical protein HKD42_09650 [Altererythrobacter sp. RZ02]|uniref:Lipoprotein n=1 Tax=Pontixanthobacter rizhaonensis TaxID=2730337 RepID=A0A848QNR9_9SPHN|nr:hypothetical protein [Pontixanthobacter rizhaonensis]NMW32323.1 hypothetical protein [Pontixanthobacter rizhaonensis]
MRLFPLTLSSVLFVAACSPAPNNNVTLETADGPALELVLEIEERLSRDTCLKDIATMRREYRYGMRDGKEIRELIDIRVQEAGWDDLPGGIIIKGQSNFGSFDSRSYFVAFANYHIANDDLDLWACGDNAAGANSIRHKSRY